MLRHPCILGGPQQRGQNQKSKPTPGVTMMHHATKRGFKDCPGFLNSTGRLKAQNNAHAGEEIRGKWLTIQICHILNAWEAKKNPCTEPKTCEKGPKLGFEYLPTSKTSHCVRTACALRAWHSPEGVVAPRPHRGNHWHSNTVEPSQHVPTQTAHAAPENLSCKHTTYLPGSFLGCP